MAHRTWFKVFASNWLRGTLRNESPELRGIFVDILALAADGAYGDAGEIKMANAVGVTDDQIARILRINLDQWQSAKQRLMDTDRISVDEHNIIKIVNWEKYQSEYQRQRPYREARKLREEVTEGGYESSLHPEGEGDREGEENRERRKKEKEPAPPDLGPIPEDLAIIIAAYEEDEVANACKIAVERNKPRWDYVVGILKREHGNATKNDRKSSRPQTDMESDPGEYYRRYRHLMKQSEDEEVEDGQE